MNAKVALIGSGNAFFMDEGIGLYAGKYLKENFTYEPSLDIIDGGTLGFLLMPLLQEYEHVIIANTSSDDSKAVGTITVMSGDELIANQGIKKTANEVEITEMLQICSMASHCAQTTMVSIVPEDIISVCVDVTSSLRSHWERYIEVIVEELAKCGIQATRKKQVMGLDEILEQFANPSIEHGKGF
ncbi:hydrogenase maturation protease [Sulfuricurvum kujiense DSM 16994]|uniref:Hydrogenase maturation protease n=1 Tax=Sulfuricurvum kujiense (strain ATCC BAA-921 / DSM 16994 / JCM 11577 / YK-1) TaxID=709032 RepID=E4U2U3_SULKY|nr:hydrogenase maturation protease [Sulfuricurvum kujiense]ADR34707.1 hydrogenase maturation protease [Sulfuricurvum kujiense DSM 16994]